MPDPNVALATRADIDSLLSTLTLSFSNDPIMRWLFAKPATYLRAFPLMIRPVAELAADTGSAYRSGDPASGIAAASLWLGPGIEMDGTGVVEVFQTAIPAADQDARFRFFGQMDVFHPDEAHWYLPVIGADPACQGQGHGSALLKRALEPCDEAGLPAYLESSNPANIPLYERFGFEVTGEIQVDDSPTMWPMYRQPRERAGNGRQSDPSRSNVR